MNVHKDDLVLIIAGKDKSTGKRVVRARVRQTIPEKNQVIVEGVNVHRKHTRGRSGGAPGRDRRDRSAAGRREGDGGLPKCNRATRVGHLYNADGTKSRQCRNCGEVLDNETDRKWRDREAQFNNA